jgi:hypothetical protein
MTSWRLSWTAILFRQFQFKDPLLSGELHIGRGTLARRSPLVYTDESVNTRLLGPNRLIRDCKGLS